MILEGWRGEAVTYWFGHLLQITVDSKVALVVRDLPANAGDIRDLSSIPELGRSHGEGNGNTLQYSCLANPMERGAWQVSRVVP